MRVQDEEFKTMIYDLMNGHYDLDKLDCEESSVVENEFAEGRYCEKLYSEMLAAYGRICQRLHETSGEDRDVEIIINNLLSSSRTGQKINTRAQPPGCSASDHPHQRSPPGSQAGYTPPEG